MKIAFLAAYFKPFSSGMENNCYYLARELAKKHDVHVYTADRKDGIIASRYELLNGIKVHRFNVFRYKYYFYFSPAMFFKIMKEDFDVIHVHGFGFLLHDVVIFFKKIFSNSKLVCTPHGPFMALKTYKIVERIVKSLYMSFLRLVISFYEAIIEVNTNQYDLWMRKEYGVKKSQLFYLPNGISASEFKRGDYKTFEKKYNLKDKFVISYLGRFNKYKGIDQIIKVLPAATKKHQNVVFLSMGKDAGYLSELKIIARNLKVDDKVRFIEDISDDEKFQGLEKSEIFILPSEWEAFGIVIVEAMAHGNAIISTRTEGGQFLVGEENGSLYDYGNINTLQQALFKLIEKTSLRKKMQKNNLKKSKEFVWEKIAVNLEKHYVKLLK